MHERGGGVSEGGVCAGEGVWVGVWEGEGECE